MPASATPRPAPGRPRDPLVDDRILTATEELLVTEGYQATTIAAVARRAGIVATSIYRRWPGKRELVEDTVFGLDTGAHPVPTGDLHADLRAWTELFLATAAHPAARAAIPGLLADYHGDQALYHRLLDRGERPTIDALRELLAAAAARGTAAPDCDVEAIFEILRGATLLRALTHGLEHHAEFCERITRALVTVARASTAANDG
ncbi:TetR/AcrR family transcriptional regulator [Nocardia sp. NPDC057668]|uniref:TetR/AcrR family transcriptional regulator n=1 Tax=Nocardia sp. NPDC057668 TaxID=3346202 RepID=UPI0036718648